MTDKHMSTAQGHMNDKLRNEGLPVPKEADTAEPMSAKVSRFVETWTAPMVDRLAARKELNALVRQAEQAAYDIGHKLGWKHGRTYERRKALEDAARVASRYTGPGTKNVHPDVSWEDMNEAAQHVSHTTAQGIAFDIRALSTSSEPGEDT